MELRDLIAECTAYDFKVALEEKKPKSWLKSVSAFANGLGGSLFFGVNNIGVVIGLDNVQHVGEVVSQGLRDKLDPLPNIEMIPLEMEGKKILQVKVYEGSYTPYYYIGDGQRIAYVCIGQLKKTCKYLLEEKQIYESARFKRFLAVSTPNCEPLDPFDAYYFNQEDMLSLKEETQATLFITNQVDIYTPIHLRDAKP